MANLSIHWEMLVTGGRFGLNGLPGVGSDAASVDGDFCHLTLRSFLATLGASVAAGLNGPGLLRPPLPGFA